MTPPTVNAYYSPPNNDINFPAGILQPPFFDNSMDPAVNFGGIGVVIGHEMTHGFDDQGSKYDPKGNVRQWFTAEDRTKFKERTDCEVKEYDGFKVAEGQNLNGKLTLGENTADNGGMRIAFQALRSDSCQDGATPSRLRRWQEGRLHTGSSGSSSRSDRCGARIRRNRMRVCWRRPILTAQASGGPRARCRTSTSSARLLAAR